MPAFRDLGFRLSYLALVDGPVLSSACEDTHGKEMAELLLGLEGDGETCQRGTGLRAPVREERNAGDRLGGVYISRAQTVWVDLRMAFFIVGTDMYLLLCMVFFMFSLF